MQMLTDTPTIQDMVYIRERLGMDNWNRANVFSGLITGNGQAGQLVYTFLKNANLQDQIRLFEQFHTGYFTLKFDSRGPVVYFRNGDEPTLNGHTTSPQFTQDATNKMLELRLEIERLKAENKSLKERLEEFEDVGGKFGFAIGKAVEMLFPQFSQLHEVTQPYIKPVQGMPQDTTELEQALAVLIDNFGEDWLIRFAAQVQNNPGIVSQVKTYFQ